MPRPGASYYGEPAQAPPELLGRSDWQQPVQPAAGGLASEPSAAEKEKEALLTVPCALGEARRRRGGAAAIFDRLPCCAEGAKLQERLQLVEQRVDRAGAELTRAARAGEFEVRQLRAEVLHLQRRLAAEGLGGGSARPGGHGSQRAGGGAEFRDLVAQVAAQRAEIDEARRRAAQASQRGAGLRARLEERRRSHAQEVEELTRAFKVHRPLASLAEAATAEADRALVAKCLELEGTARQLLARLPARAPAAAAGAEDPAARAAWVLEALALGAAAVCHERKEGRA